MSNKEAGKSSKKLARSARQANHNKAVRLHKILLARQRHIKHALQSCGKDFADELKEYYDRHPTASVGKRAGTHQSV